MAARPEHVRAPEVARAALKEATDLFGHLLATEIRSGSQRGATRLIGPPSATRRAPRFVARTESGAARRADGIAATDDGRAWREERRDTPPVRQRDARPEPDDPLASGPRPRPAIGRLTLMDLGPDTCRFPFGDGPFRFCGAMPVPGKPYCAACLRGLYRSPERDDVVVPRRADER
jgi:hypothetical protein